jgi:hypothetical protein
MLVFVVNILNEGQIPEIWETAEDKKLNIKELKEKYTKYAYDRFIKEPSLVLLNHNTKWNIEVTTRVIKEWWKKSRTRPRIIAIQLLDVMIETASLIRTGKDAKNTPGIESVSNFKNSCKIDSKLYKVHIIVKKQPNRRFAYYYGVTNIEIQ